jgi:exopolysaccharide biosynthesis polyprenyl glycosylphosphotransferase
VLKLIQLSERHRVQESVMSAAAEPHPNVAALALAGRRGLGWSWLPRYVAPEMACLWLIELVVCALVIYIRIAAADGPMLQIVAATRALGMAGVISAILVAIGLYNHELFLGPRRLLINTMLAALLAFPMVWLLARSLGVGGSVMGGDSARVLRGVVVWVAVLCCLRLALSWAIRRQYFTLRVAVVGSDDEAGRLVEAVRACSGLVEVVSVLTPEAAMAQSLLPGRGVRGLVVTDTALADIVPALNGQRVGPLWSSAEFWEQRLRRVDIDRVGGWHIVAPRGGGGVVHRAFDILLSLALLIFTLPVMALTAVIIRLDSPGPILYRQARVGLGGAEFTVFKFRSMVTNAEARGPVWASQRDPRVTRVGSFIRLTRIDELPQLWNVLSGEMSFIGPRPERPHFTDQLDHLVPHYRDRLLVKPGLTGWAQVNYPYGASVEDARAKLSYDLYYVKHRTLFLDLMILFATVRVVLFQHGAR